MSAYSKVRKWLLYGALFVVLGIYFAQGVQIFYSTARAADENSVYKNMELFSRVLEMVKDDYVDGKDLTYQELIYSALEGMLNSLDPHSEFLKPQRFEELKSETEGKFGGIGIVIGMRDGFLTVIAPMEGTPAFNGGIISGDRIIKVDGRSTERFGLQDAVDVLRGEPGTKVKITIYRPSSGVTKEVELERAIIRVDTVKDINGSQEFPLGDDKVGYVRLTQFGESTSRDLEKALQKLESQGMRGLVLDLRANPGGLLDQAVKVAGKFLPEDQLVVSTEGRELLKNHEFRASGGNKHPDYPIVVLVNGGSASASEIVAGCLRDLDRAIILGEQTFGKGSVQSVRDLKDGSALRLTTAKYYTPSHEVIHGKGITPDVKVPISAELEEALFIKRTPGWEESIKTLPSDKQEFIKAARDIQLERAFDLIKGLVLFADRRSSEAAIVLR
ncbi:MAG: S41 family peptidase [Verrucomicrobia bacterium]|nr:S41 family peptidase [Verrucomicrobiota bacterium]MCF7709004.1 S41 family peptidase [Verrucomicrobiota bacterium]